jgi:uncharacterized protein
MVMAISRYDFELQMTEFTPLAAMIGGALIGLSAVMLMFFSGRIAGVSSILGRLIPPYSDGEWRSRLAFIVGLIVAPLIYSAVMQPPISPTVSGNLPLMIGAGLLVGFGATVGGGCTSGHGVCGLSRFSARSLAATATFMAAGFATVYVARHLMGGG